MTTVKDHTDGDEHKQKHPSKDVPALNARGVALLNEGHSEQALDVFNEAVLADPHNEEAGRLKAVANRYLDRLDDAEQAIKEALKRHPHSHSLLNEHGFILINRGQYKKALAIFNKTFPADPKNIEVGRLRSVAYRSLERWNEAEQAITEALEQNPDSIELQNERAFRLFAQGRYQDALDIFDKTILHDPHNEDVSESRAGAYRMMRRFKEAEEAIAVGLNQFPNSVKILTERGFLQFDQAQYVDAAKTLDKVLKRDPSNVDALFLRARAFRSARRFEKAESAIAEAVAQFPDDTRLLTERGLLNLDLRQPKIACTSFDDVLKLDPANEEAITGKITALDDDDRTLEAFEFANGALARYPQSVPLRSARAWLSISRNDWVGAAKDFEEILASDPDRIEGLNGLGAISFFRDRNKDAEFYFRRMAKLHPSDPAVETNLAWALTRLADEPRPEPPVKLFDRRQQTLAEDEDERLLREAEAACRRALATRNDYAPALSCLGVIAYRRGQTLNALDFLKRSSATDSKEGGHANLGALYVEMGNYEEAVKYLGRAIELNRNDASARVDLASVCLRTGRLPDAIRLCREAVAMDPHSPHPPRALAMALVQSQNMVEAERVLRNAISRVEQRRRWPLHTTLAQVLIRLAATTTKGESLLEEARKEAKIASAIDPMRAEPHFQVGAASLQLEDYRGALRSFQRCVELDRSNFEAERLADQIKDYRAKASKNQSSGVWLAVIALVLLGLLWGIHLHKPGGEVMLGTLSTLLLGMMLAGIILPSLTKLKLAGLEAELGRAQEKLSSSINVGMENSISGSLSPTARQRS